MLLGEEHTSEGSCNINDEIPSVSEYIYNVSNSSALRIYVSNIAKELIGEIKVKLNKIDNQITKIKLTEVISQLEKIKTVQTIKENHMTAMLIAYEILKELKSL